MAIAWLEGVSEETLFKSHQQASGVMLSKDVRTTRTVDLVMLVLNQQALQECA